MDPILDEALKRLVHSFSPKKVFLFGSRARGNATPDSDYDLLVIVPTSNERRYRRMKRAQVELWGVPASFDVIVLTEAEAKESAAHPSSLVSVVMAQGRSLYAA